MKRFCWMSSAEQNQWANRHRDCFRGPSVLLVRTPGFNLLFYAKMADMKKVLNLRRSYININSCHLTTFCEPISNYTSSVHDFNLSSVFIHGQRPHLTLTLRLFCRSFKLLQTNKTPKYVTCSWCEHKPTRKWKYSELHICFSPRAGEEHSIALFWGSVEEGITRIHIVNESSNFIGLGLDTFQHSVEPLLWIKWPYIMIGHCCSAM